MSTTDKVKIKVATFNLKCDTREGFGARLPLIMQRMTEESPDIVGFQEARPEQQEMLEEAMTEYTLIGFGREANFRGESNAIAFKTELFTLFGFHQCWLSPTPFVPGTRFEEQSSCPRICVTVMLKHRDMATPFRFYNTHLDHVGERARVLGMGQILERMKADNADWRLGVILTGDMNAEPDSEAIHAALTFADIPLQDTTAALPQTFHNYGKINGPCKIDYIFTDSGIQYDNVHIWNSYENGQYLTDHYPVSADLYL